MIAQASFHQVDAIMIRRLPLPIYGQRINITLCTQNGPIELDIAGALGSPATSVWVVEPGSPPVQVCQKSWPSPETCLTEA